VRKSQESLRRAELRKRSLVDLGDKILRSCRSAVTSIHSNRISQARGTLKGTTKDFKRFLRLAGGAYHLQQWGYVVQVVQEFVEASLLLSIASEGAEAPLMELDKLPELAVLYGISDLIGELRRAVVTSIAREDIDRATYLFGTMSELYGELASISLANSVAPGLRRKLDVNRSTLESTLSVLTEEMKRRKLEKSMEALAKVLRSRK